MPDMIWQYSPRQDFVAKVERFTHRRGILTVTGPNNQPLLRKLIALSYGARFGPDVADVERWEQTTSAFLEAFVLGQRTVELDDIPSVDEHRKAAREQAIRFWAKLKCRLGIRDTDRLDTTNAHEAVTRALNIFGRNPDENRFSRNVNDLFQVAGHILGDFQIHVFDDGDGNMSYSVFWQRRNRWMSGRNIPYNLGCAIDEEIEKPYTFDPSRDHLDPGSEDARMRDAIIGLNRP